jgi:hypothetical protein
MGRESSTINIEYTIMPPYPVLFISLDDSFHSMIEFQFYP